MAKKPAPIQKLPTFDDFGTPSSQVLQGMKGVSGAISKIIKIEDAADAFHHTMIRNGICARYELALAIASDMKAFVSFTQDARIKALARPPLNQSETLRSLFQATYPDPKKSSKYYRRVEPLWAQRSSPAEVLAFLEENGISKPPQKVTVRPGKLGPRQNVSTSAVAKKPSQTLALNSSIGNGDRVTSPATNRSEAPCGEFYSWPSKVKSGRTYDLRVKIIEGDGEMTTFDLLNVTPA